MDKILTIAIPTYNRPEQIQKQVRLLLPQLNERVCLIVYDNNSDTNIRELFNEDELKHFVVFRNCVNVGADANIARCFEYCETKWLWTLSDDDFVKHNAIEIILNDIDNDKDVIFFNYSNSNISKTVGFDQLSYQLRKADAFACSFSMSYCVYNIKQLKNSLLFYYNNLSSMMGTIILVLKYVEIHTNAACMFINNTPIDKINIQVGWNYGVYIKRTKLFIDAFKTDKKHNRKYNKTLFLGCHNLNYLLIIMNRDSSNLCYFQRWNAFFYAIQNQGILNALYYSPKYLIYVFLKLISQYRIK